MKKELMIACCMAAAIAICGCVQTAVNDNSKAGEGGNAYQRHNCGHVHVKSVLGLTDEVLADTNRFLLGAMPYSHQIKLDKPLLGCTEARVYLNKMELPRLSADRTKPHRLRSVELKRVLPGQTSSKVLLCEAEKVIDEIAKWLDVETPDIELVDIGSIKRETLRMRMTDGICTCICFELANGQEITVRLTENGYVIRDGVPIPSHPAIIEIDITYNNDLLLCPLVRKRRVGDEVKIEKELDIGDDCSDKLAKAIRAGIDRCRVNAARRKK